MSARPTSVAFDLSGLTAAQRQLIQTACDRCRYDFGRCLPTLRAQWGKPAIEVVFSDLSRWGQLAQPFGETHGHHDGEQGDVHVEDPKTGAVGHGIQVRQQVLGLAWSNGKIELDLSLERLPELAQEVFLSEVAHEVDWFDPAMDRAGEERVWDAFHPGMTPDDIGGHGHDWFDVGPYESWAGEAWMGLFTAASSDVRVTLTQFVHRVTPEAVAVTRELLGLQPAEEPPPPPPATTYFGTRRGATFHDAHQGVARDVTWPSREAAIAAGRRPCGVCRP